MIWVRGQIVADDALKISVLDRTFEHGLGLFETFRTWSRHPTLLPRHLDRLVASACALGLPLDPADLPDQDSVFELMEADGRTGDSRLRITLSGGLTESSGSTLWMRSFPLPPPLPESGLVVGPVHRASADSLAGHKTLNYWANRRMYESAEEEGFDECLTSGTDGSLWEASRSNLFVVVNGRLLTPPCDGRILPGVMRALILERAKRLGLAVHETPIRMFDASFQPSEVFLTNSSRGIMPVGKWGEANFPAPGPVAQGLWDDILPWLESGGLDG
jgi:branched-chain amino acid aminotransferase